MIKLKITMGVSPSLPSVGMVVYPSVAAFSCVGDLPRGPELRTDALPRLGASH